MKNARFRRSRALHHGVVWLLIIILFTSLGQENGPGKLRTIGLPYIALLLGVQVVATYVHFWLLTHLMERRRYALYTGTTLMVVLLCGALLYFLDETVKITVMDDTGHRHPASYIYGHAVGNVVLGLILATIARYVRRGIVSHFQMQQLRALQLETELSLLKAQVNQHFLFNTLNNLYGLSLAAPDQMPEALLQLAGLMRYQLDSSRQGTVTVGTEAEYLANYIGLEKLRLRHNTQVEFITSLPHPDQPLAPLLLLPLVENCFKHAIGPSGQNTIRIELTQTDVGLTLRTGNSVPPYFRPAPSGLGLPTLQARLAQYYPGTRHRLAVEATDTFYAANLQLVL